MFDLKIGKRTFKTDDEADMRRLGEYVRALESSNEVMVAHMEQMKQAHEQMMQLRPAEPQGESTEVVAVLNAILKELRIGHAEIVQAQLADTVLKRDPVTGAPDRSVKVVK